MRQIEVLEEDTDSKRTLKRKRPTYNSVNDHPFHFGKTENKVVVFTSQHSPHFKIVVACSPSPRERNKKSSHPTSSTENNINLYSNMFNNLLGS
jgi:hypothetical protein